MRDRILLILLCLCTHMVCAQQVDKIDQYIGIGRVDEALELATSELRAHPTESRLYILRAQIYSLIGQPGLAILDIDEAIKRPSSSGMTLSELYQSRGEIHEAAGMYIDAYCDYLTAIERDPNSATAQAHMGDLCSQMRYYPLALRAYQRAEALDAYNTHYPVETARTLLATGQHHEAAERLRHILAATPDNEEARKLLAAYHYSEGRYDLYADLFIDYINVFFRTNHYMPASAKTLLQMENEEGYSYLIQALDYQINHQEGDLAVIYQHIKAELEMAHHDYERAVSDLTHLITTEQDYDHSALLDRADCYYLMGHYDQAIADYDRLITHWHYGHIVYLHRAQAKEKAGLYLEAIEDYCTYAHLDHTQAAEAYLQCARIEDILQHPLRAEYYRNRSIEITPNTPEP